MSTLVLLEHNDRSVRTPSLAGVALARALADLGEGPFDFVLIGDGIQAAALGVAQFGARSVVCVESPALAAPLAERHALVIARLTSALGASAVVGAASTYTRDVLPRTAALLDAGMLTDVVGVEASEQGARFRRPMFAGNVLASVDLEGPVRVLGCRATAFSTPHPDPVLPASPIRPFNPGPLPDGTEFVSREQRESARPDLTEARVIVSGGRPLRDADTFLRLIGGLADAFGGAVGATRAAVDSGIAPNDWQVGQTGKIVAPELYVACGVSGAIQHLAGMKDSRVIVAINKDPEAPIFQAATYGLVADLHQAVPELTEAVRAARAEG